MEGAGAHELAMFPLHTALLPETVLPLHVFEPRYRVLVERCLAGDREFGTVLIERGHEVGGGDTRFGVGSVVRMLRAEPIDDGRWFVVAAATQRLRVREWLPDDPHPRAIVERLVDRPGPRAATLAAEVVELARQVIARRVRLGEARSVSIDLAPDAIARDPVRVAHRAVAAAGLGALDVQRLLEVDDGDERLERAVTLLAESADVLGFRLDGTGPGPGPAPS